jgi:hemolysin activation/secretion protein
MYQHRRLPRILALLSILTVALVKLSIAAEPGAGAKVLVKEIRITGAEAIPASEFQPIVAPYVGKEADLSDLRKAADAITDEYRARGYNLARAIVPEQDLSSGVVEIRVLEARIGKITVQGNNYYSNRLIEGEFAGLLSDKAVKQSTLEKGLLLLNDQYPDINATAGLQAGAEPGTTDIVVSAKDILPVHLTIDYNNFGVQQVSRHILGVQLDASDPWLGSHFAYRENTGFDPTTTHNRRASLDLPINNYGTRFGGYFANGNFAVGGDFASLNETGTQEGWGLSFTHPFMRTRSHKLSGEFGFDLRDSTLFQGNIRSSLDRIRLLKLGLSYEGTDSTGRNFASIYVFQGLGTAFGGSENDNPNSSRIGSVTNSGIRKGADDRFTYGTINLLRLQTISSFLRAIVKASGQVTSAPLVASEQFGIGGPDTVRGYRFKELIGDNAFNAGAELRVLPIPGDYNEAVQLSLGLDYGLVQQRKPAVGQDKFQSLLGYGPGIKVNLPFNIFSRTNYFTARFDVGFPINPSKIDNRTSNTRPVYYVSTALRF